MALGAAGELPTNSHDLNHMIGNVGNAVHDSAQLNKKQALPHKTHRMPQPYMSSPKINVRPVGSKVPLEILKQQVPLKAAE